jgi:hypothetical protein
MPHHSDVARVPPRSSAHGAALLRCTPAAGQRVDDETTDDPRRNHRDPSRSIPDFQHMLHRYLDYVELGEYSGKCTNFTEASGSGFHGYRLIEASKRCERRRRSSSSLRCSTMHAHAREKLNGEGEIERTDDDLLGASCARRRRTEPKLVWPPPADRLSSRWWGAARGCGR